MKKNNNMDKKGSTGSRMSRLTSLAKSIILECSAFAELNENPLYSSQLLEAVEEFLGPDFLIKREEKKFQAEEDAKFTKWKTNPHGNFWES